MSNGEKSSALVKPGESALPAIVGQFLPSLQELFGAPEDYGQEYDEKPVVPYVQIRQKPLVDEATGDTLKPAGAFKTSDPVRPDIEDRKSLLVSIIHFNPGRVYFQSLGDKQPTCKSTDAVHGSRPREGYKYGTCSACELSAFQPDGKRPKCSEIRALFVIDWQTERPAIITFSPSGLKPFRYYDNYVDEVAARLPVSKEGKLPFVHHLIATQITLDYKSDPAPHYIPVLTPIGLLPKGQMDVSRRARREWMDFMRVAYEQQEIKAEDVGAGGP